MTRFKQTYDTLVFKRMTHMENKCRVHRTVRLPWEVDQQVRKLADKNLKSFSSLIIFLLKSSLERRWFLDRARFEQAMVDFLRCSNNLIKMGRNVNLLARHIHLNQTDDPLNGLENLKDRIDKIENELSILSVSIRDISKQIGRDGEVKIRRL